MQSWTRNKREWVRLKDLRRVRLQYRAARRKWLTFYRQVHGNATDALAGLDVLSFPAARSKIIRGSELSHSARKKCRDPSCTEDPSPTHQRSTRSRLNKEARLSSIRSTPFRSFDETSTCCRSKSDHLIDPSGLLFSLKPTFAG